MSLSLYSGLRVNGKMNNSERDKKPKIERACDNCNGNGYRLVSTSLGNVRQISVPCLRCNGTGKIGE